MREAMAANGSPPPKFSTDEARTHFLVELPVHPELAGTPVQSVSRPAAQVTAQVSAEVTAQVMAFCREPRTAKEIMALLGLKHWKTFQSNYLLPWLDAGLLERTIPDKPRSRLQKYRLTAAGRQAQGKTGGK